MVNGHTVRCTNGILTTVALANGVFLIVVCVEVELQVVHNLASLFRQTILLQQGQHGQLNRSQWCGQFQHYAGFAVLKLLFAI